MLNKLLLFTLRIYSICYRLASFITNSHLISVFSFELVGVDKSYHREFYTLVSFVPFKIRRTHLDTTTLSISILPVGYVYILFLLFSYAFHTYVLQSMKLCYKQAQFLGISKATRAMTRESLCRWF